MSTRAKATFAIKSWEEKTYEELEGDGKLTRASVEYRYEGEIEGVGKVEYLMAYSDSANATYVGVERIVGRIEEREGSFILQHIGMFEGGTATSALSVVPGSGTGHLSGLRGEGEAVAAGDEPSYPVTLDYTFE